MRSLICVFFSSSEALKYFHIFALSLSHRIQHSSCVGEKSRAEKQFVGERETHFHDSSQKYHLIDFPRNRFSRGVAFLGKSSKYSSLSVRACVLKRRKSSDFLLCRIRKALFGLAITPPNHFVKKKNVFVV